MPNLKGTIQSLIRDETAKSQQQREQDHWQAQVGMLRFAWAEGHKTLYKFKSLANGSRHHVRDIIENSRVYFSVAEEFNDPLDCSPTFKFGGNIDDPAFIQELRNEENLMIKEQGLTPNQVADLRRDHGTNVTTMAKAITNEVRADIRRHLRIFCLSSTCEHPLLWSHYANRHSGVCLHFSVRRETLFGLARGVDYSNQRPPVLIPLSYNKSDTDMARLMSLVKADFWQYESEYRILSNPSVDWGHTFDGRFVSFEPELLTGVTLGMCMSPVDRNIVIGWATHRETALPIFEAYEDPNHFWIKTRQVV